MSATWTQGKPLVGLNFNQERREADFRFSMVRVRENAESVAFYQGEQIEVDISSIYIRRWPFTIHNAPILTGNVLQIRVILSRFGTLLDNYSKLLIAERNLDFFTTYYKYIIQLLPVAVVAPIYFRGRFTLHTVAACNYRVLSMTVPCRWSWLWSHQSKFERIQPHTWRCFPISLWLPGTGRLCRST